MVGTWIAHIDYDLESRRLTLLSRDGRKRVFAGVPDTTATAFEVAPDWSQFFDLRIKGRFQELAPDAAPTKR